MSADEIEALEKAAIAVMAVTLTRSTLAAYKELSAAHDGILPENLKADLQQRGFDIDALESDCG